MGFAASHIYPHSLPFPERKEKKKVVYFILLRNQRCKENHLPPLPCFPVDILPLDSHYPHKPVERPETACPFPLGQWLKVHAQGWGQYREGYEVSLWRSITCQDGFKHFIQTRRNKKIIHPFTKARWALNREAVHQGRLTKTDCKPCCHLYIWEVQCTSS